jgi:deoxycytidylate deaminase
MRLSKSPTEKRGAALLDSEHMLMAKAYNGLPRGLLDLPERLTRSDIRAFLELSAIDNILFFAAQRNTTMFGSTLYCAPVAPTLREATLIIRARCMRVVYAVHSRFDEFPHLSAKKLLEEAGIECKAIGKT